MANLNWQVTGGRLQGKGVEDRRAEGLREATRGSWCQRGGLQELRVGSQGGRPQLLSQWIGGPGAGSA